MKTRELYIMPLSEAENYFVQELLSQTKDKVAVQLGEIFGRPYNTYTISEDDFMRIRSYIKAKEGS